MEKGLEGEVLCVNLDANACRRTTPGLGWNNESNSPDRSEIVELREILQMSL